MERTRDVPVRSRPSSKMIPSGQNNDDQGAGLWWKVVGSKLS